MSDSVFNREGIPIEITFFMYDTKSEMHRELRSKGYRNLKYSNDGIAIVYTSSNKCEVYAVRPKALNDKATKVLGHEVLHCIYGEYHSNDVK